MYQAEEVINQQPPFDHSADKQEKLLRMKKHPQAGRFPDLSQTLADRSGEGRLGSHLYAVKNKIIFPLSISALQSRVPFGPPEASTKC